MTETKDQKSNIRMVNVGGRQVPMLTVETETIKHPDGRQDVIIKVPPLQVRGNK